jgi:hypothetical protein
MPAERHGRAGSPGAAVTMSATERTARCLLSYRHRFNPVRSATMSITGSCPCGKTAFRMEGGLPVELTSCTFSDSPAFGSDGSWDQKTRRIGVNASLFDNFDATTVPVLVIDGKNFW